MDKSFFDNYRRGDYQRENFDSFLTAVKFSYNVPSIHVAGTNGKGSTVHYIAGAYAACGYKTGLFHSPFLSEPNEMISINGKYISDDDFLRIINQYKKQIDKFNLSGFEIQTFVALTYFEENKCDIAVIECGLGGEIDATNVFVPALSIITSVALEHTDALGYTISEIAAQKAGIIRDECPALVGDLPEEAMTAILKTAKESNSKLFYLGHFVNKEYRDDGYSFEYGEFGEIKLASIADYSVNDATLALEALTTLKDRFPYDVDKVREGLRNVRISCRMEVLRENPRVIVDGAHNPEAMKALCSTSIANASLGKSIHVVFACFKDKNLGNMLSSLGAITDDLTLTTFDNPRARTEDEYFLFIGDYAFNGNAKELIQNKINEFPDDVILVTGSLAFAAYVRDLFKSGEIK